VYLPCYGRLSAITHNGLASGASAGHSPPRHLRDPRPTRAHPRLMASAPRPRPRCAPHTLVSVARLPPATARIERAASTSDLPAPGSDTEAVRAVPSRRPWDAEPGGLSRVERRGWDGRSGGRRACERVAGRLSLGCVAAVLCDALLDNALGWDGECTWAFP
jgi:hypothetical protein